MSHATGDAIHRNDMPRLSLIRQDCSSSEPQRMHLIPFASGSGHVIRFNISKFYFTIFTIFLIDASPAGFSVN